MKPIKNIWSVLHEAQLPFIYHVERRPLGKTKAAFEFERSYRTIDGVSRHFLDPGYEYRYSRSDYRAYTSGSTAVKWELVKHSVLGYYPRRDQHRKQPRRAPKSIRK